MDKPFLLLANQRSGTNLVTEALRLHPDVLCLSETEAMGGPFLKWFRVTVPGLRPDKSVVMNAKYNQLDKQYREGDARLDPPPELKGYRVIHLVRQDLLHQAVSLELMGRNITPGASRTHLEHEPVTLDAQALVRRMSYLHVKVSRWVQDLTQEDQEALHVIYEDMTGGDHIDEIPTEQANRILHFLDVDSQRLKVPIKKVARNPSRWIKNWAQIQDLSKSIRNSHQALVGTLRYS